MPKFSKPRENKNGKGNPRNARAEKNFQENLARREVKTFNQGVGQREVRRRAAGIDTRSLG